MSDIVEMNCYEEATNARLAAFAGIEEPTKDGPVRRNLAICLQAERTVYDQSLQILGSPRVLYAGTFRHKLPLTRIPSENETSAVLALSTLYEDRILFAALASVAPKTAGPSRSEMICLPDALVVSTIRGGQRSIDLLAVQAGISAHARLRAIALIGEVAPKPGRA